MWSYNPHVIFPHGKQEEKEQAPLMNRNEEIPKQNATKINQELHSGFVPQNARWV